MPDNRRKLIQYKSRDLQEIIYDRNVVNFSDNDKTVPAVYRSCAQSYQFILLCLYLFACHRPLLSSRFFAIFPAAVAKVYIVSFAAITTTVPRSSSSWLPTGSRHQDGLGTWGARIFNHGSINPRDKHRKYKKGR